MLLSISLRHKKGLISIFPLYEGKDRPILFLYTSWFQLNGAPSFYFLLNNLQEMIKNDDQVTLKQSIKLTQKELFLKEIGELGSVYLGVGKTLNNLRYSDLMEYSLNVHQTLIFLVYTNSLEYALSFI